MKCQTQRFELSDASEANLNFHWFACIFQCTWNVHYYFFCKKVDFHDWYRIDHVEYCLVSMVSYAVVWCRRYGCTHKPKSWLETLSDFNFFCTQCELLHYFGCRYFGQVTENEETISNVRSCMCRRRTFLCIESKIDHDTFSLSLSLWSESEIRSKCEASHEFWRHIKFFSNVWHECKKYIHYNMIAYT